MEPAKEQILTLAVLFEPILCALDIFVSSNIIDMKGATKRRDIVKQWMWLKVFRCSSTLSSSWHYQ
jgi:hypothetical protein